MKQQTGSGARELIFSASKKDFKVQWFSGTGAGGQYRNKHQNCCRLTHIESGITTTGQEHRERPANLKAALNRMAEKLVEHYGLRERPQPSTSDERIRTYHSPRNEVKDHASGHTQPFTEVVDDANIGEMLESRKKAIGGNDG